MIDGLMLLDIGCTPAFKDEEETMRKAIKINVIGIDWKGQLIGWRWNCPRGGGDGAERVEWLTKDTYPPSCWGTIGYSWGPYKVPRGVRLFGAETASDGVKGEKVLKPIKEL